MLKEIKDFVTKKLEKLIRYSLSQDKEYLKNNYLLGGTASTYIQIKYGNLIIKLEGQVIGEIKEYCNNFKDKVVDIITRKNFKIKIAREVRPLWQFLAKKVRPRWQFILHQI